MSNKYVNVTITRQTRAVSQQGFGMALMLATSKASAYKEYSGDEALAQIGTDFGAESKEYKLAASLLGQTPRPEKIATYGIVYDGVSGNPTDLVTALNTLILTHDDFYALVCPEQGDDEITALANWIGAQDKIYVASTSNKTLANTLNSDNVFVLVHDKPEQYPAEGLLGQLLPQEIGSYTWQFKTINGITPAAYSTTDISEIEENNGCAYITVGGVNITSNGVATSGEFMDIIQASHYIKARMTENVFRLLATMPKVPYTDDGINLVVAEMERTLKDAFNNGIIAEDADGQPMYSVTAPTRNEVAPNDRAARLLPDLKWTATVGGAIHKANIAGVLQI